MYSYKFTFQCGSTEGASTKSFNSSFVTFTFQCGSTEGESLVISNCHLFDLHSSVVLLKEKNHAFPARSQQNLHSSVVLLKDGLRMRGIRRMRIYIPVWFY